MLVVLEMGVLHVIIIMLIYSTENVVGIITKQPPGVASFSSGSIWDEENDDYGPSNITGCRFDGNTATDGGAIYTAAGYDMVVNSSFTRNFAGSFYG